MPIYLLHQPVIVAIVFFVVQKEKVSRVEPDLSLGQALASISRSDVPSALTSALADSGKTTLLSEWVAGSKQAVAWLSLDKGNNGPTQLWRYAIAA